MDRCLFRFGLIVLLIMSAIPRALQGAEIPAELVDSGDRDAYAWLLERSAQKPWVQRKKDGTVEWIGFEGATKYTCSLVLDDQGRVTRLMFNKLGFSNDEIARLAAFRHVKELKIAHNFDDQGPNGYREGPNPMSGAGWIAFAEHGVTTFGIGGCNFDGDGAQAVSKFPLLEDFGCPHTRVKNADLAHFKGHPTLKSISLSPMWGDHITDEAMAHLAEVPHLQRIRINETYLTYASGLKHLEKLRGTLKELDLDTCVILPEDVERFREAMPGVEIKQRSQSDVAKLVASNFKGAYSKLSKRAPTEVIEYYRDLGEKALAAEK